MEHLREKLEACLEAATDQVYWDTVRRMPSLRNAFDFQDFFEERLYRKWAVPLRLYEVILALCQRGGMRFKKKHNLKARRNNDWTYEALLPLQARSCLIASEILSLLKSGHASGALARWRTLHETSTTALFLSRRGPELSKRYLAHAAVQSHKLARTYNRHVGNLSGTPLTKEELSELHKLGAELEDQYGKAFFYNDYAWAHEALNESGDAGKESTATFRLIEEAEEMGHMRPYHRNASRAVHANADSLMHNVGLMKHRDLMLAGPSNYGLSMPGKCALVSLSQATIALLNHRVTGGQLVRSKLVLRLVDDAKEAFEKVQQRIEKEEAEAES